MNEAASALPSSKKALSIDSGKCFWYYTTRTLRVRSTDTGVENSISRSPQELRANPTAAPSRPCFPVEGVSHVAKDKW